LKEGVLIGDQVRKYSSSDTLTGLGDREAFSRELARFTTEKHTGDAAFSLAVIDIDHFKSVNDGFGHIRGDEILTEFGKRLSDLSRGKDLLFRYGGDEFTALLPYADRDLAEKFAVRMLEAISGKEFQGNPPLTITLSIGIAQFPDDGLSGRELFSVGDRRLYIAKRMGRNRVVAIDYPGEYGNSAETEGRLLGREKDLSDFVAFRDEAADKGRGFFLVLGPDGAGKGRFLEAAASMLSFSDYRILKVSGKQSDMQIPHSALAFALECEPEGKAVLEALFSRAGSSMSLGVFLHDMHLIDPASIDDIHEFYNIYPGWMIVSGSTERSITNQSNGFGGVSSSVRLGSISLEDCRAWFRYMLMWDPPEAFLEWFHGESSGLPGLFIQGIRQLEGRGFLVRKNGSYIIDSEYSNFPLRTRLSLGTTAEINNLPVELTPFIGRLEELTRIREMIDAGCRLITLKGMSGIGCRRLAIKIAGQNEFLFPAGACLVDCGSEGESGIVKLAGELSLSSDRDICTTIECFLGESKVLLLLANVSPGDELVSFIPRLLCNCSGVTVIVTSRDPLDVPGEFVLAIGGISTVQPADETPSDAARIFIQTAERLGGIRFQGDNGLNMVEEICTLLGGSPLAVELAASWVKVMSVSSICRRIRANPSFPGGTEKEKNAEGLFEVIQLSWEQLSGVERSAAARLTVFASHFTVDEAEEISDVSPEMILSLIDRSFLQRDDQGIHITSRWKDFIIKERTPYLRGIEVAREMHCRYFASRAAGFGDMVWNGREAGRGLNGFKDSFDDIALAWKLAIEKNRHRFLRQIQKPLFIYCVDKGRFRTGFSMLEEALSNSDLKLPEGLKAVLMANQSTLAGRLGRATKSHNLIEEALDITEGMNDVDRAAVLFAKGSMMVNQGSLSSAAEPLQQALAIFSGENCLSDALEVELMIVKYYLLAGDYNQVRKVLPAIAERCRQESFRNGEWRSRLYMGNLAAAEGDYIRAREAFLAYHTAVKTAGYTAKSAMALNEVAGIEANQGSYGEAEQHYATAEIYFKKIGSIQGQAGIKMKLAVLNQMRGSKDEIVKNYTEALSLGEKAHDENIIAGSLSGLAFYYIDSGETAKASSFLERAALIAIRSGNRPVLIRVLSGLAVLDRLNGNPIRSAVTALALLHNPSADAQAGNFCMDIISRIREDIGESKIEELKQGAESITLHELLDMHSIDSETDKDGIYRVPGRRI
jgi:diguanylate cyclase (GGDEF)-like protein